MTKERTDQNALDQERGDFAHGSVRRHIVRIAAPMALAQLVQILYSVVDRIYIGHIPGASSTALTGLGLSLPLVTIILACANLYGTGGVSLCSIARGKGDEERAERIMGNSFFMILVTSVLIMALCYVVMEPLLVVRRKRRQPSLRARLPHVVSGRNSLRHDFDRHGRLH